MAIKKRILFVIPSIYGGGAERVMRYLLNGLDRDAFAPSLCVFKTTGREKEVVPGDVPVYDTGAAGRPASLFLFFKLARLFRRLKPDLAVSFMWGTNLIAISAGLISGTDVIAAERIHTPSDIKGGAANGIRKKLISFLYRRAERVLAVSGAVKEGLTGGFSVPADSVDVIYNGVDLPNVEGAAGAYLPQYRNYIVACGRLERQKNFTALIEALAASKNANVPLVILGEGAERKLLETKARALGVRLYLPGYVDNPYPWIRNASIFVSSSRYEGMPNVVLEAMALQAPVIAMDAPGVTEVLENGKTGIVVPVGDRDGLARAIDSLLADAGLRSSLAAEAYRAVKERFSLERMLREYEKVFSKV